MKHFWKILVVMAVMLSLVIVPATVTAANPTLLLENKTGDPNWSIIGGDGISATLDYNSSGATFDFNLNGVAPVKGVEYSLIYYADPYPGNNPGALLGTGLSDADTGAIAITGSVALGYSLPIVPDTNINGDYCTKMCGDHLCNPQPPATTCSGAKIWLVATADYSASTKSMIVFNWANYLFETDLINYTYTPASGEVVLTTNIPEDQMCVTPDLHSVGFGDIYRGQCGEVMSALTITNCGNVNIRARAVVGGELYTTGLQISHGEGWVDWDEWSTTLNAGTSKVINLRLCIPSDFSVGTAVGSLWFTAEEP
jgi:hypothetical protein